jgi:hypothetical protein
VPVPVLVLVPVSVLVQGPAGWLVAEHGLKT